LGAAYHDGQGGIHMVKPPRLVFAVCLAGTVPQNLKELIPRHWHAMPEGIDLGGVGRQGPISTGEIEVGDLLAGVR